jgi:FtsZ-binding cell division protein ZapB
MAMNQLRIELVEAKDKIDELIVENELLRKDLQELKAQNEQLISENRAFKRKIEELTKTIKGMNS